VGARQEKVREAYDRLSFWPHSSGTYGPHTFGAAASGCPVCEALAAALAEVEEWEELIEAVDDVIDWHREHESVPSLYPLLQIMWRRREKLSEVAS